MSFTIRNLSVLAYANGFTLWHYKSKDEIKDIVSISSNYFSEACDMLSVGDIIMITGSNGATIQSVIATSENLVDISSIV